METISICHWNNVYSYCLELLNISWKVFVIMVYCLSYNLVTEMWIVTFRPLYWISVEKRWVQFSPFEWMNRTDIKLFEWMPQFSEWTLLVVERMLKPFEWMPKPFKGMLQFSERTLLVGEQMQKPFEQMSTPFERMSLYFERMLMYFELICKLFNSLLNTLNIIIFFGCLNGWWTNNEWFTCSNW